MNNSIVIAPEVLENKIYLIRGQKVMLDTDLAQLYGVEVRQLNQQVRRNISRFPHDFMFGLTLNEENSLRSQFVILKKGRGQHKKFASLVFTEQGVAMLSSVLNSDRAIQVNIAIMRTFIRLRSLLASHADLVRKLDAMEKEYDENFQSVFAALRKLMKEEENPKSEIGFRVKSN